MKMPFTGKLRKKGRGRKRERERWEGGRWIEERRWSERECVCVIEREIDRQRQRQRGREGRFLQFLEP